jgi:hypothetical protein
LKFELESAVDFEEGRNMRWSLMIVALVVVSRVAVAAPIITFSGSVDGSGTLTVNSNSVSWSNLYFQTPTSVLINGTSWDPLAQPTLPLAGPLIPSDLSDYFVTTTVTSGRDLAVAEIVSNQVLIHFDDTPNGADNYQVQVGFTPKPPPIISPVATLHIVATIDGSDVLQISNSGATWIHKYWNNPSNVSLNGNAWDTVSDPTLPNSGATAFLPTDVDLSTVVFTKNAGRDTATYEVFPNYIDVFFADNPVGGDAYDVTLNFGSVPEPSSLVLCAASLMLVARGRSRR